MRLSTVVELLLILLLVAFAAYGRVIERDEIHHRAIRAASKQSNMGLSTLSLKQATDNVNRYCTCNENICNCCRDFHIPLVQLKGPGCASLQYLQGDNLAVQLSFGDNILTSTVVSGKSPKPVCVPLPGGFTKFCGRIYSIQRDAKDHFKACLGLELQSATELEASLRVSCFRFGPDGLNLRPSEPLPVIETEASEEEDDDDFFGLGSDDDDDEDDEDEGGVSSLANSVPNSSDAEDENDDDDDDDEDILGFDSLLDIITGEDDTSTKKPKVTTSAPLLQFTIPILTRPTSAVPLETFDASTAGNNSPIETGSGEEVEEYNQESVSEEESNTASLEQSNEETFSDTTEAETLEEQVTEATNKVVFYAKPDKVQNNKVKVVEVNKKKPSLASISINSIVDETKKKKKPLAKPDKDEDEDDDDILGDELDDDDDDDDEDEEILSDEDDDKSDEDDEEKDDEHESHEEDEDEKAEEVEDLDDDDDEDEDAMISALVYDEKKKGKKNVPTKNQSSNSEEDDSDYDLGLTGLLARRRSMRSGRQSKVMRL